MQMQVDEPRQHVHAGGIDFLRCLAWCVGRSHISRDIFGFHDGSDTIAFNYNVHRAACRCAGPVDESRITDNESFEGPFAFGARRGWPRIRVAALGESAR
jgi:hypothetical protein